MINAIITDIEGTTSSIAFVKDVLFPYAAQQFPAFLHAHWDDPSVQEQLQAAAAEAGEPLDTPAQASDLFRRWIEEDRKATPLKALQGMIWKAGYENGDYTAHMYPDTAPALRQWHDSGLALYVYSSGLSPPRNCSSDTAMPGISPACYPAISIPPPGPNSPQTVIGRSSRPLAILPTPCCFCLILKQSWMPLQKQAYTPACWTVNKPGWRVATLWSEIGRAHV